MKADALAIRDAAPGDLDRLAALGTATYREHFAALWTEAGLESFLERDFSTRALSTTLERRDAHLWLLACDADGVEVGFAKLNWARPVPGSAEPGAELQKIYLRKSAAGQGYGSVLVEHAIRRARERGEPRLWLEVLKSNQAAQDFYSRSGFAIVGEQPYHTDKYHIGLLVMVRSLDL
jgi:ribosomal protein S18 acetylase RimI-like enzyme